jgi:hypothetical protein
MQEQQQQQPLGQQKPENNNLLLHLQANVQPNEPAKQETAENSNRARGNAGNGRAGAMAGAAAATATATAAYALPNAKSVMESAVALAPPGCSALLAPMPLATAVLKLLVLSPGMQIVHQHRINLFRLWEQQQQLTVRAPVARSGTSSSDSNQGCVLFHATVSLPPAQFSQRSMNIMHIVLTLQQQAQAVPPMLVAEVPLLLMPAAAHQEVQQLLLPAMRQDAQAGLEAQQQQAQKAVLASPASHSPPADLVWQVMSVEHAVWTCFAQLAADIQVVMQLAEEAVWEAACEAAAAGAPHAVGEGTAGWPPWCVDAVAPVGSASQHGWEVGGAEPSASAAAALEQLAGTLLFPLLLPFLAAHGLSNMLQLVLDCLPAHIQQQWQQQQLSRLQALQTVEAAPGNSTWLDCRSAQPAALTGSGGSGSSVEQVAEQTAGPAAAAAAAAGAGGAFRPLPWHLPFTQFADPGLELR